MELQKQTSVYELVAPALELGIEKRSLRLPMLPKIVTEVLALVDDKDSDMSQLAKLIEGDPSLAAHMMRVANSPAFAGAAKMSTLQQAIARLGMGNIAEMALAISMGPAMFKSPGFEKDVQSVWRSSLGTALWAREIARLRRQNVEVAFLAGMLAQIGKPAVLQASLDACEASKIQLDAVSAQQLIESYHAKIAVVLTNLWDLPVVAEALIGHYDLDGCERTSELVQFVVETIQVADSFSSMMLEHEEMDLDVLSTDSAVVAISFYPEDVETLLEKGDSIRASLDALMI